MTRPLVLFFDDEAGYRGGVLRKLLGDGVRLESIGKFPRKLTEGGDVGFLLTAREVAAASPQLIILDLALTSKGDWRDGPRLLHTLRSQPELAQTPVFVASDWVEADGVQDSLGELGVPASQIFFFQRLNRDGSSEQTRFRLAARAVLGPSADA